jgi:branched-chain amino acid transport system substrate-binding protein
MKFWKGIVLLLVLSVLVLVATGCSQSSKTIKIGVAGSMTGDSAIWGQTALKAAQLAVDQVNAQGGVLGRQIVLVPGDDQADPQTAANVAQQFASDPSILGVIGHEFSSTALPAAPIYQKAGLPYIIVTASNPRLADIGNYVFRINADDIVASAQTASYTVNSLHAKNIGIIYDNDDYGRAFKDGFAAKAQSLGAKIVDVETYVGGQDRDFSVQLTKLAAAKPDTVLLSGYDTEAAMIVVQAKQLGFNPQFVSEDGVATPNFIKLAGSAANGVICTTYFNRAIPDPNVQAFVKMYESRYNEPTFSDAPYAYDAMNAMIDAIKRAGKPDRSAIRDALVTTDIPGVTGQITFAANGSRQVAWNVVVEVVNGQWVIKDMIRN